MTLSNDAARSDAEQSEIDDFVEEATIDETPSDTGVFGKAPATPSMPEHAKKPMGLLTLGALGVVFGDIGTSPLYALQTVFSEHNHIVKPTPGNVYGIVSMVFWAVTLIVFVKYVMLALRADNEGEGGILALVALLRRELSDRKKLMAAATIGGILGASLFYGDSVITPAISVMSAIEGLTVIDKNFADWVLPLSVIILSILFFIQRWGTGKVGKGFGPIMVLWFVTVGALGLPHVISNPRILLAVSPTYAISFAAAHPFIAFVAMGAVVLTITGAEALYADMGHFGATPIRRAWFYLVFPALVINYMGQGAMLLDDPSKADNPFFRLAPESLTFVIVILATIATVIASQSVIAGAFSVSRQATRLGLLPRLTIKHTSKSEGGQIYIASINAMLFVGVLLLISIFQSSARLAAAYGLAVTCTLMLETIMFSILMRHVWKWKPWLVALFVVVILGTEALIFSANLLKIFSGGWIPILIASVVTVLMLTWRRGQMIMDQRRAVIEGQLQPFIDKANAEQPRRTPGIAVFPHPNKETTPLALKGNYEFNQALHETVIICNIINENVPHIRHVEREHLDDLGSTEDGVFYIDCHVGFNDSQDVPKAIKLAFETFPEFKGMKEEDCRYFLSVGDVKRDHEHHRMNRWRAMLYIWLTKNQADRNVVFHTPKERTIVLGAELFL